MRFLWRFLQKRVPVSWILEKSWISTFDSAKFKNFTQEKTLRTAQRLRFAIRCGFSSDRMKNTQKSRTKKTLQNFFIWELLRYQTEIARAQAEIVAETFSIVQKEDIKNLASVVTKFSNFQRKDCEFRESRLDSQKTQKKNRITGFECCPKLWKSCQKVRFLWRFLEKRVPVSWMSWEIFILDVRQRQIQRFCAGKNA